MLEAAPRPERKTETKTQSCNWPRSLDQTPVERLLTLASYRTAPASRTAACGNSENEPAA